MKVIIKIDEKTVITPIRDFPNVTAAHIWFNRFLGNFILPENTTITIEEVPTKVYKVVYNEIVPHNVMVEAKNEQEAKDMVAAKLENYGIPSWQFVTVIEQK
jgi:hypothetical protein